jgi:methionyl-tRNA formyltransferase
MDMQQGLHQVELLQTKSQLSGGELLFLISCSEIIKETDRSKYQATLVLHASDLPKGRGWSPHIWEIEQGAEHITLSLLEAEDKVDSGRIWAKRQIPVTKDALWNEINHRLFTAEIELIDLAVRQFGRLTPEIQAHVDQATYYPKRAPQDSQIDPHRTIAEQFNRMRVCDPNRFPVFFELHGKKYKLILEKLDD